MGAVAVDSDYNMKEVVSVVETMIDFEDYFDNWEECNVNYVGILQEWSQQNDLGVPEYSYRENRYNDQVYCTVEISQFDNRITSWNGVGESKSKARMNAAKVAYEYLEENGFILNEYEEAVGVPDEEDSLRQINELVQKKLISKPSYEFTQQTDSDGDTCWTCVCRVAEVKDYYFTGEGYGKREAQRQAAYYLLLHLMGYEDEQD